MGAAGGALLASFVGKAAEMESFELQLTALTGSSETARAKLQQMTDFAAKTPFDLPGVVSAGTVLTGLGASIDAQLPRAANLASVMRRDLSEAGLIWGKSLKGSQDGLQSLYDAGITTREELETFGAVLKDGVVQVDGSNLEKLQGALEKMVDTKFGGVMAEQSKGIEASLSSLGDAVGQVQASLGEGLVPTVKNVSDGLTGLLNQFKALDPGTRTFITTGILLGTVLSGVAAAGAALTAVLLPATAMWGAYTTAAQASAASTLQNAVANHAATVTLVEQTAAEVAAAQALVAEARAAVANATSKEAGIIASEALAIAETELAAATEANVAANAQYTSSTAAVIGAQNAQTAASTTLLGRMVALATTGLGPLILLLGAVALALAGYTAYLENSNAAAEKQVQAGEKQVRMLHEQRDVTIAAAEAVKKYGDDTEAAAEQVEAALRKAGNTDLDVTQSLAANMKILQGLYEQLSDARFTGDDTKQLEEQIKRYEQRNAVLREARTDMRGLYDAQQKASADQAAALKKEQDAVEKLLARYKEKASRGVFASNKEELAALDEVLGRIGKQHKDYAELKDARVKLTRDAAAEEKKATEDAAKAAEKVRKEQFDQQAGQIELIVGSDQNAIARRIALLQQLRDGTLANAEERHKIEVDLARELESLEKSKAAAAKAAEEEKKKAAEESAKARQVAAEAEKKQAETTLEATREKFARGEDVLGQLRQEIEARDAIAAKVEREKAAAAGVGKSAATRAALEKQADAEIAANRQKSQSELEKLEREGAKRQAEQRASGAEDTAKAKSQEEAKFRARFEAGEKVEVQLKAAMERRQAAEREAIRRRGEAELAGTTNVSDRQRIQRDMQLELNDLASKQVAEQRALTEELEKQKRLKEDAKKSEFSLGGVSGVEGAGDFSAFDVKRSEKDDRLKKVQEDQRKAERLAGDTTSGGFPGIGGAPGGGSSAKSADKSGDKSATKPGDKSADAGPAAPFSATLEMMAAALESMKNSLLVQTQLLQQIQANPVKVDVTGAGGPAAPAPDWRTSTNKTGDL